MWYHMKSKTLEREYDEFHQRLQQLRKKNEHVPEEHMRLLMKCLQRLKQELTLPDTNSRTRTAVGDVSLSFIQKQAYLSNLLQHNERERFEKQIELLRQRLAVWQNILNK
jgi:hypothetical protein